jgi:hypothetical protein
MSFLYLVLLSIGLLPSFLVAENLNFGLFFVAAAVLSDELLGSTNLLAVAGANVSAADACVVELTLAAFLRAHQMRKWSAYHFLWIAVGASILFSWARGIAPYGMNHATNGVRPFLWLWGVGAYISTFEASAISFDRLFRWWTIMSLGLLLIILSRYFYPLPSIDLSLSGAREEGYEDIFETGFAFVGSDYTLLRVVGASSALIIAQTALLHMIAYFKHSRSTLRWLIPVWLGLVLLLQHRTVWVTFLICTAMLLPSLKIRTSDLLFLTSLLGVALLSSAIYLAAGGGETVIGTSLGGAIDEIGDVPHSTWFFRTQLWLNYLDQFLTGSVIEYAFGQAFGTTVISSFMAGTTLLTTEVFPHDFFIHSGFYLGGVGLAVLLALYVLLLRYLWPNVTPKRVDQFSGRELAIFLVSQLVFSVTYGLNIEQGVLIGAAIALGAARDPATSRVVPIVVAGHSRP